MTLGRRRERDDGIKMASCEMERAVLSWSWRRLASEPTHGIGLAIPQHPVAHNQLIRGVIGALEVLMRTRENFKPKKWNRNWHVRAE